MSRQIYPVTLQKNSTTPGTPVKLVANSTLVKSFTVQARKSNTGTVYFGFSSSTAFFELAAQDTGTYESITYDNGVETKIDLANVYLDVDVSGEGVNVNYELAAE